MVSTGWERAELDMFSQFSDPGRVVREGCGDLLGYDPAEPLRPSGRRMSMELYRAAM